MPSSNIEMKPAAIGFHRQTQAETAWLHERLAFGAGERMTETVLVTPGMAELMAEFRHATFAADPEMVMLLVEGLKERGSCGGDIVFSNKGFLIHGQDELTAIRASGVSVQKTVVFRATADDVLSFRELTACQMLEVLGLSEPALRAEVARLLSGLRYDDMIAEHALSLQGKAMEAALYAGNTMRDIADPVGMAVAHYHIAIQSPYASRLAEFWLALATAHDAETTLGGLRSRLCLTKMQPNGALETTPLAIGAWNAWIDGETAVGAFALPAPH